MKQQNFLCFILAFFFCFFGVFPLVVKSNGLEGLFPVKNYSSKDYKELPQNWAITQDQRGVMYFGNHAAVLEYDGVSWRAIVMPNESAVRSLAFDKKNQRVYVGAVGEIGFLKPNKNGVLEYKSLIKQLAIVDRNFADVWRTFVLEDGTVFFQSSEKIIRWDGANIQVYKPQNSFHLLFKVNNKLYVRDSGIGLLEWNNNQFVLIPGTEMLANEKVYFMLPFASNKILLNTRNNGLMLFNPPAEDFPLARFTQFKNNCNDLIVNNLVYNAVRVSPNLISIGTLNAGLILIDTLGNVVNHFTKNEGLQQETVYYQFMDHESKLWLALANGISKIDVLSPITFYNDTKGLEGSVKSLAAFNDKIYVATNNGVFYLNEKNVFVKLPGLETECWDLKAVGTDSNKQLLIASNYGLYSLDKTGKLNLFLDDVVFSVNESAYDSSIVYVGKEIGFAAINISSNKIIFQQLEGVSDVISMEDEDETHLWLGTSSNGVIELINEDGIYRPIRYNETNGFVAGPCWVAKYRGEIVLATGKGLYRMIRNKRGPSFELFKAGGFFTGNLIGVHRAFVFYDKLWLAIYSNVKKEAESIGYLLESNNEEYYWEETPFLKMPKNITHSIFCEPNGVAWIGRPDGLYRYDSRIESTSTLNYQTIIRRIIVGKDSLLYGGTSIAAAEGDYVLSYSHNSVSFGFASNSYEDEFKNTYTFMLEGNDETWSNWTYETKTNYTNLREGDYVFKVKARNVYGKESAEAVFSFTILPPWYRTWWAYLLYVVVLVLVVWGAVAWSTRSLRKIIAERTAEISQQKEELNVKNKEITDSINYAQRLQKAILPYMEDIRQKLPNVFIYYKPRDIVSGDLYWYADKGSKVYIASIDCTGHGVPGAFLSVVANSALNEIVNQENEPMPHVVLQKLDEKITSTLRQGSQNSSTRDGMDVALCMFDKDANTLYYSGANRPLFFIRDNQLEKIKGDKFPIGGGYDSNKQFSTFEKKLQKNDAIYIFSDGYPDQFGGADGKKFMIKRFGDLLLEINTLSIEKQEEIIKTTLINWQEGFDSVDDILVIGIKV